MDLTSAVLLLQCRLRQLSAQRAVRAATPTGCLLEQAPQRQPANRNPDTTERAHAEAAEKSTSPPEAAPGPVDLSHIPNVEIVVTKSPRPQRLVSLDNLENELAIATESGADVLLNSPRSIEACRRAGIEAQELLPPTFDDVMLEMRSVRAPPAILRTLASKRLHFREKERRALFTLVRNIRQRLISGGFEPVRSLSPENEAGTHPPKRASRSSTPTNVTRNRTPQRTKSPGSVREEARSHHAREVRERIDAFLHHKAEEEVDAIDQKIATAGDRAHQLSVAKRCHVYCRAAEAIVRPHPHRGRSGTPEGARGSPRAHSHRHHSPFPTSPHKVFTEEHAAEVRERALRIESLRVASISLLDSRRAVSIRTHSPGPPAAGSASAATLSASPQTRSHSKGYSDRLATVQARRSLIENTERKDANAANRAVDSRIQAAGQRRTEAWSASRRASHSRHDDRHFSAHRRRDLIRDLDERGATELQTAADRKLSQTTTRKLRSIEQFRAQLVEHLSEQRRRTERCASRARQIESVRVVETELEIRAKDAAVDEFRNRKLLLLLSAAEDRKEREMHRQKHAEHMRKAIDHMNTAARPRSAVSPHSRRSTQSPRRAAP